MSNGNSVSCSSLILDSFLFAGSVALAANASTAAAFVAANVSFLSGCAGGLTTLFLAVGIGASIIMGFELAAGILLCCCGVGIGISILCCNAGQR